MEKYFSINNSNFNKYSKKVFNYINKNLFMKQIFVDFADKGIEHFIKSKWLVYYCDKYKQNYRRIYTKNWKYVDL